MRKEAAAVGVLTRVCDTISRMLSSRSWPMPVMIGNGNWATCSASASVSKPLRSAVAPFSFYVFGKEPWRPLSKLFVRTAPGCDFTQVRRFIGSTLAEYDASMSADDFDIKLFDQTLQKVYDRESKLSKLITLFTILAIIISLMGVFGLVMFEAEGRRKEIGVRRVNGATVEEILKMINALIPFISDYSIIRIEKILIF